MSDIGGDIGGSDAVNSNLDKKLSDILVDVTSAFIESDGLYWQSWVDRIKAVFTEAEASRLQEERDAATARAERLAQMYDRAVAERDAMKEGDGDFYIAYLHGRADERERQKVVQQMKEAQG